MTDITHQNVEQDGELDGADEGDLEGLTGTETVLSKSSDRSLADLERLYREEDLILDADWQREYVWNNDRASRLIESFLIGLPLPVIYLAENDDYRYEVIDGLQRLTSVFNFLKDELKLTGLQIRKDLNGCRFTDLERDLRRKLLNASLRTIELNQTSDRDLKYLMFERLNTSGTPLNDMEIRNCVYRGQLNNLIKTLAQFPVFTEIVNQRNIAKRMKDRRLVLGFLAFYQMTYIKASKGLKAFFNDFCETYKNLSESQEEDFKKKFKSAMETALAIFGEGAFRSTPQSRSINASIFQVICVSFTNYDRESLNRASHAIREVYKDLIETDAHWVNCVSTSIGNYQRIKYTFETWNERLKQVIENN